MRKMAWMLVGALLAANSAGVAWLIRERVTASRTAQPEVDDATIAQLEKLFRLAVEFQAELQNVVTSGSYSNDNEKQAAMRMRRREALDLEITRLKLQIVKKHRSHDNLTSFLLWVRSVVVTPPSGLTRWDSSLGIWKPFANLARLESLEEELTVVATSLARDIR